MATNTKKKGKKPSENQIEKLQEYLQQKTIRKDAERKEKKLQKELEPELLPLAQASEDGQLIIDEADAKLTIKKNPPRIADGDGERVSEEQQNALVHYLEAEGLDSYLRKSPDAKAILKALDTHTQLAATVYDKAGLKVVQEEKLAIDKR
jgi:hypothetical protein